MSKLWSKYCAVPKCHNSTKNTPNKLFFVIPYDPKARRKWMKMIRRAIPLGPKTHAVCCEDHFDIENDMENYVKYKLVGGPLKLKKGVMPHKFACQKRSIEKPERTVVAKRRKAEIIKKILTEDIVPASLDIESLYIVNPDIAGDETRDPLKDTNIDNNLDCDKDKTVKKRNKKIQVQIKNKVRHIGTTTDDKFFYMGANKKQGIKRVNEQKKLQIKAIYTSSEETSSTSTKASCNDWDIGLDASDSEDEFAKIYFKGYMQEAALLCISREPQLLLGLPKQCYFCIQLLSNSCKCTPRDVMIILKKLRLYHSNAILALDFGIASSHVETIIRKNVPIIASCMKSLVFIPNPNEVLANLPMPFRKRYSNVQSIIHCLEIQIEKPTNAVKQALTWSEYMSCNTIKYLISITPDGLINYISEGYGGRTSDSLIFEDCGIIDALPKNADVMADRGFKEVAHLLQQKECTLIRLPSVSAKATTTKNEVLETKNIAALRIHVLRSIERLRNFGFLMPHATVDLKQVDLLDFFIVTACGIVNLQNPLIDFTN